MLKFLSNSSVDAGAAMQPWNMKGVVALGYTRLSSSQCEHIINKTYPTQVFQHICKLWFSSSHALLLICPGLCQINISLASLSTPSPPPPLPPSLPLHAYSVLPSHFTLFHAVFLPLPRLSSPALWPAPPHPHSSSCLCPLCTSRRCG